MVYIYIYIYIYIYLCNGIYVQWYIYIHIFIYTHIYSHITYVIYEEVCRTKHAWGKRRQVRTQRRLRYQGTGALQSASGGCFVCRTKDGGRTNDGCGTNDGSPRLASLRPVYNTYIRYFMYLDVTLFYTYIYIYIYISPPFCHFHHFVFL